jgi:PhoH-like ATPase
MAKKTYVLDTSVYLSDASALYSFSNNDIVVPLKVLDEIDKHKKRQDSVGANARSTIRTLDKMRSKGNLCKGIRIDKGRGILTVKSYNPFLIPDDLDHEDSDNQIIATALSELKDNPKRKVIVVSRDINMRVKCDSLGLESEDFAVSPVVEDVSGLYAGFDTVLVDDQIVDKVYEDKPITLDGKYHPNQFLMLVSNSSDKKTALVKFEDQNKPLKKLKTTKRSGAWGVKPRNKEQTFALDLLMDTSIPVVSLVGKAGSGKTLLALAAALEQTLSPEGGMKYKRIVVTKPVEPVGKDIGFLPGTLEEKMMPWLAPIQDNLRYLFGNDRSTLDTHVREGTIEIEAMTYIRGRSIADSFIIIDESQNMTQHEIKTVLTRVGENTKIVLTGDIEQIDNVYIDSTNNGLSYVVEKFKSHSLAGHIHLTKGERSEVASIAAKIL